MAKQTFNITVDCEVLTYSEALGQAEDDGERAWIRDHPEHYPLPITIHRVLCEGKVVQDQAEDYMEHRYLIAGTGGDGYTLSVTHYIV